MGTYSSLKSTMTVKKTSIFVVKRHIVTSAERVNISLGKKKNIPNAKSVPLFGRALNFIRTGRGTLLHEYIDAQHKQFGPIFTERLDGKNDLVFLSDPELMKSLFLNHEGKYPMHILPDPWVLYEKLKGSKRGLFFMNGEDWLNNRRIMNKYLLKEDTEKWMENSIKKAVDNFIDNWKNKAHPSYFVTDVEFDLYKLSINVIINVLLGDNSTEFSSHYNELIMMFSTSVKRIFQTTTTLYGLPLKWCQALNLKVWRDFEDSVDSSLFLAKKLVSEMLQSKAEHNGLIDKLVKENMSQETITSIVSDFIIAAGDTTAYTTLWIFLLLSKNNEVTSEIRSSGRSYIKFVVKEAMRMYPVAPFLTRILPKETSIGNYIVKEKNSPIREMATINASEAAYFCFFTFEAKIKKTPIIASIYTSGRDEQYFSKPHLFLPYRWDKTDLRKLNLLNHTPSASLPFALGIRSCIGKKMAMLQLVEIISQVVNNFHLKCTDTKVNAITSQVLVPDKNIELVVTTKDTNFN